MGVRDCAFPLQKIRLLVVKSLKSDRRAGLKGGGARRRRSPETARWKSFPVRLTAGADRKQRFKRRPQFVASSSSSLMNSPRRAGAAAALLT